MVVLLGATASVAGGCSSSVSRASGDSPPASSPSSSTTRVASGPRCHECDVAYESDGATNPFHRLDVYFTTKSSDRLRPAVLFIHQGGWMGGDKRDGIADLADDLTTRRQPTWVAFSMNYTLRGRGPKPGAGFPVQPREVADAIAWIQHHAAEYRIDPARIGLFGSSSGAQLAVLAAASAPGKPGGPGKPAAVVEWSGPIAMEAAVDHFGCARYNCSNTDQYLGWAVQHFEGDCLAVAPRPGSAFPQCPDDRYRRTSGTEFINGCSPPMLLVHSEQDPVVPFDQERRLADALHAKGVPHIELLVTTNRAAAPPYLYDPNAASDHGYPQLVKDAWDAASSSPDFLRTYLVDMPWVPGTAC